MNDDISQYETPETILKALRQILEVPEGGSILHHAVVLMRRYKNAELPVPPRKIEE